MKQWFAVATLAIAASTAQAGPFTGWDLNGSAALLATPVADGTIRLTDQSGQVGTAWAPGALDWSAVVSGSSLTMSFAYNASAAVGDGLALFVTSGSADQAPTGVFGLGGEDDGLAFFIRPAVGEAGSADKPNYPDSAEALGYITAAVPASVDLLASAVYGQLTVSFLPQGKASFELSLRSNPLSAWEAVAYAEVSALGASFENASAVRVGFGGSTADQAGHFDLLSFSGPAGLTPAVPEPGTLGLMAAGLGMVCAVRLAARRRQA